MVGMMAASEARYRVEHANAINDLEETIDYAVCSAVEQGNFKVAVYVSSKVDEEGRKIVMDNLKALGYAVTIHKDSTYDTIMIEW